MEPHHFLEEKVRNVGSIITFVASNKVSHLGETIHCHYDSISSLWFPWEGHNEVYANIIPRPCKN